MKEIHRNKKLAWASVLIVLATLFSLLSFQPKFASADDGDAPVVVDATVNVTWTTVTSTDGNSTVETGVATTYSTTDGTYTLTQPITSTVETTFSDVESTTTAEPYFVDSRPYDCNMGDMGVAVGVETVLAQGILQQVYLQYDYVQHRWLHLHLNHAFLCGRPYCSWVSTINWQHYGIYEPFQVNISGWWGNGYIADNWCQ